jgi:hypothetical protein
MSSLYNPTVGNKVCAYTFKNEKELPPGKKLLMCSKCKETFYETREAQLAHWPDHKRSCCAIEKDPTLSNQEISDPHICLTAVSVILNNAETQIRGRGLLHSLKLFLNFMKNKVFQDVDRPDDNPDDVEKETHWQMLIDSHFMDLFQVAKQRTNKAVIDWIWAIPGFANFFLDERNYICNHHGYCLDPGEEQWIHPQFSASYFGSFFILAMDTIITQGTMAMNSNKAAIGFSRFLMKIWGIDEIRRSIPLKFRNKVFNHVFLMLTYEGKHDGRAVIEENTEKGELVPGLILRSLLKIMIDDMFTFTHNPVTWMFNDDVKVFWSRFSRYIQNLSIDHNDEGFISIEERLDLMEILYSSPLSKDQSSAEMYGTFEYEGMAFPASQYILQILILSPRIAHVLKMYYAAKDPHNGRPRLVIDSMEYLRKKLLDRDRFAPKVDLWTKCVLYKVREQNIDIQAVPPDILDLITEFSLPSISSDLFGPLNQQQFARTHSFVPAYP